MRGSKLSEGKTKIVFTSDNPGEVVLFFKDDITAGDGKKHDILAGKGRINATVSAKLFQVLESGGIRTHLVKQLSPTELLTKKLKMIPLESVCRILAAGHMVGLGKYFQHRQRLRLPVVEFYLKDDALHDPFLNSYHVQALGLATSQEIAQMESSTLRAAEVLEKFFNEKKMLLADFKLEFGRDIDGGLLVGDELSVDSMRLWDKETYEILDKDRFRKDLPKVFELAYLEPYKRICGGDNVPS
jgi:phosphoribosylaminoimidazole-succinocarboxamide synthase